MVEAAQRDPACFAELYENNFERCTHSSLDGFTIATKCRMLLPMFFIAHSRILRALNGAEFPSLHGFAVSLPTPSLITANVLPSVTRFESGSKIVDPIKDKDWGDRCGGVQDPFGHHLVHRDAAEEHAVPLAARNTMAVKALPDGWHTVTPRLFVNKPAKLVEFLKHAFGATSEYRNDGPTDVRIGDSIVMVSSTEFREGTAVFLYLYVEDTDAAYRRAIEAGATSLEEPEDMFYGDRRATVKDPFGNTWQIATHKEDLSLEEIHKRAAAMKR